MSDARAAVIAAVVAGIIAIVTTWMTSATTRTKESAAEKRQKLEAFTENAIKLNQCIYQYMGNPSTGDDCAKDGTTFRLLTLSSLYFPELKAEAGAYAKAVLNVQLKIAECRKPGENPEEKIAQLKCFRSILENPTVGAELDKLISKAEREAKTLW